MRGLRVQILAALAIAMTLAFAPLGFAVTRLTDAAAVAASRHGEDEARAALAAIDRLVVLYVASFAAILLILLYVALTRRIVAPASALVAATSRVSRGLPFAPPQRLGSSELDALSDGIGKMAGALLEDRAAMRAQLEALTQARSQLARSERLASVGRLSAGLAHEIGNPLAAVLGLLDLLDDASLDAETRADLLARAKKETERIHRVLRDLLDFARPEAKVEGGAPPAAVVREVLDGAKKLVSPQRSFRDVTLAFDCAPGLVAAIEADRLTQVVLNLLLNAADAGATRVTVRATSGSAGVTIAVEDDGPGFPEAIVEHAFEPFVTTKGVGEGTGLGLAVCRGLVEGAGGSITIDPAHAGARVVVTLPSAAV